MNDLLKNRLEQFEMIDQKGQPTGLVKVESFKGTESEILCTEELIAIENALKFKAHYIYFRRFKDRPPVPQVYIYDFSENVNDASDVNLITLHQRLYSSGHVPMFFVFTIKDVRIFNCYEKPAIGKKLVYKPLTTIQLASNISSLLDDEADKTIKAFSGKSFDNGTFWESSPFSKDFQFHNSAYEKLLTELNQALTDIIEKKILPAFIARRVIVLSILIKYLEERRDEFDNTVFPKSNEERISIVNGRRKKKKFEKNFFEQFCQGAESFTDVLKKQGAAPTLFDYLSRHFNGGIFQLSEKERAILERSDLTRFALFLEGKLEGIQFVFWRLYSFNDLPVELISNIYEEFLEKRPGVVYTPPYLVNFLLDEAMPFSEPKINFKVLDPACGSGVFLVGAYRRLIYRWRKNNKWKKPDLKTLKKLLKENIFGSDKDPDAVNLSVFSLCLALCDELTPLEIWEDLQFDNLRQKNIYTNDFFELLLNENFKYNTFDLVIGNPPFEAKLTSAAKQIESRGLKERTNSALIKKEFPNAVIKVPDNQIALLFLEQAIKLCKQDRLTCLIQPSGPLIYNNTSFLFRNYLLQTYNVPQIVDFTHLSRILFGKNGDVATCGIFIKNQPSENKGLLHITVRRTKPHKEKIFFELDTYDFHFVPHRIATSDPLIWKCNFLGGSRFHQLFQRLSKISKVKDFLLEKENSGWAVSEGFTQATKNDLKELKKLKARSTKSNIDGENYKKYLKKIKAKFLTGSNFLPTEALTTDGIYEDMITNSLETKYFHSKGKEQVYKGPHILIKETIVEDKIPIALSKRDLSFKHRIIGVHAPERDLKELQQLFERLRNSKLNLFYLAGTSAEFMVNRSSSFLKADFDNLPFSKDDSELNFSNTEKVLFDDFWKYLLDFRRSGEAARIATDDVKRNELNLYSQTYCDVLNSVYGNLKAHDHFETASYLCLPFYFNEKPNIDFEVSSNVDSQIEDLAKKIGGVTLRITRIIRLYEGNVIYIIKPKKLRYWLRSIALRDADETFVDLRKQGY